MKDSRQYSAFRFPSRTPRQARAFSLYNALVTLIVVSTVATIAVPSLQQLLSTQRMAGAINTLITALHLARSEAIRGGVNAALCPSVDGRNCTNGSNWEAGYLLYIDRNANNKVDADEFVVKIFEATNQMRLRTSPGRDHVRYTSSGLAPGSNATFTLCHVRGPGTPRTVVISIAGRVRTSAHMPGGGAIVCPAT